MTQIRSIPVTRDEPVVEAPAPVPAADRTETQPLLEAFGFERNPFPVVPDAAGFYLSRRNETIVAEILHSIETRKGFMVITGEVGLGKTTLSRRLLADLEERGVQTALVFNTFHQGADLLREINKDFGIETGSGSLRSEMEALNRFLLRSLAVGVNCAIIIDDAQQLTVESLELVRQVSNLETDSEKLVQILLIGQPELDEKLGAIDLRQLDSRVVLRHRVAPFTLEETAEYLRFKLVQASRHGRVRVGLTPSALRMVHRLTRGNPRQINVLMDRCLYGAIAYGQNRLDRRLVVRAARDARKGRARVSTGRRKAWIETAVLVVLLAVLAGLWLRPGGARDELTSYWEAGAVAPESAVPVEVAPEAVAESAEGPAAAATEPPIAEAGEAQVAEAGAGAVEAFLAAYGLEQYLQRFDAALASGWMDPVSTEIRRATGLRLVGLTELPGGLSGYTVLDLDQSAVDDGRYLLFWQPRSWSSVRLYFQYREGEVRAMQRALAELGHYSGEIDGLAGPLTSTALRRFQSQLGLPRSGIPDTTTLFLLEHLGSPVAREEPVAEGPVASGESSSASELTEPTEPSPLPREPR